MRIQLITTGRRSGAPREVTLYAWPDGDRLVVVGSLGGAARDPAWALNLRALPQARLRHGATLEEVDVHEARGEERERLWQLVVEQFALYATYQRRTRRSIPLFVLTPRREGSG